jgi:hypothetical protein
MVKCAEWAQADMRDHPYPALETPRAAASEEHTIKNNPARSAAVHRALNSTIRQAG